MIGANCDDELDGTVSGGSRYQKWRVGGPHLAHSKEVTSISELDKEMTLN